MADATLQQSYDEWFSNNNFRVRCQMAATRVARQVVEEDADTEHHAERLELAKAALTFPVTQQTLDAVVAIVVTDPAVIAAYPAVADDVALLTALANGWDNLAGVA